MEVLQIYKHDRICCSSQRCTYGLQGRSLTRTSIENWYNQMSQVGRKYETTIQRQPVSFSCPCSPFAWKSTTARKTSNFLKSFMQKIDGISPNQFKGVHINDIPIVEDSLPLNNLLYDIDFGDGNIIGELARRGLQKYDSTVRLLRYNNHTCYVSNVHAFLQPLRCPNCDTFFSRTSNLERILTICGDRVKNVYPRNVYKVRETLFDTLDSFVIKYTSQQKLFQSICV